MERFNSELTLTSSETADLLAVHPSTVKRWCNDGELPFDTTAGGHRRIHLDAVLTAARERSIETVLSPFHPYEPHVWTALQELRSSGSLGPLLQLTMGWVARGRIKRCGLLFDALAAEPSLPFSRFVDEAIGGLMERVGRAWEEGRMRVAEEHLVSQVMAEVLLRLVPRRTFEGGRPQRPVAVVGTMEGNQHHLGALAVRVLLERIGWDVCYLGPDVPIEDFAAIQRNREARLVCVSVPPPAAMGDVARVVRVLDERYDASRPYALALGGTFEGGREVPDTAAFTAVSVFGSCGALEAGLATGFAAGRGVAA